MKFLPLIFVPFILLSQTRKADTVFCDCEKARNFVLKNNLKIGPTIVPQGGGISEISGRNGHYAFEKEHHTAWYRLPVAADGTVSMEVFPVKPTDDYDFMIFKAGTKNFCDSLQKFRVKPVRACISRNRDEKKGLTGMNLESKKERVAEGPGEPFVKSLEVKKGDVYYLVLDNVSENGAGHTIYLYFEGMINISGQVTDQDRHPVKADVSLISPKGDTVQQVSSDVNGNFKLQSNIRKNTKYTLSIFNENAFFDSREITLDTPRDTLKNIVSILPELKKGGKYNIRNINFYGGSADLLPSSVAVVNNLYKLMKKNPGLKIHIVGHTNGCLGYGNSQKLSEDRAATVKNFLKRNSIDGTRITTEGKSCKEMLFPVDGPSWQQSLNRRVEVKVTEYDKN